MSSPRRDSSIVWPGGSSLNGPHAVGAFALCRQLHAYAHVLHLRPMLKKQSTEVGNLIHAGLAYRYGAMLPEKPDWYVYTDGYEAISTLGARYPNYMETALTIFDAYQRYYAVNVWTPVAVEHQFVVQFEHGPYSCRTDLLAIEDGRYVIVDHKSVGKIAANTGQRYATDYQMLTNLAITRALGYPVERVVINAMSREMPNPAFARFDVPINEVFYNRLGVDTAYYISEMRRIEKEFPDPRSRPRNPDACVSKVYGICDFHGLCSGTQDEVEFEVPENYTHGRQVRGT